MIPCNSVSRNGLYQSQVLDASLLYSSDQRFIPKTHHSLQDKMTHFATRTNANAKVEGGQNRMERRFQAVDRGVWRPHQEGRSGGLGVQIQENQGFSEER